jgi:hypothetical protein
MGIIQFLIFIAFILVYAAIVGALIVRVAAHYAPGLYNSDDGQDQEVALRG